MSPSTPALAALLAALLLVGGSAAQAAPVLQLALREEGQTRLWHLPVQGEAEPRPAAEAAALRAPLGSLWKLFVHAWLQAHAAQEPAFECRGQQRDEVYCCEPGQRIEREQALLNSCGLYYEPKRLGIAALDWQRYWQQRGAPEWLQQLAAMRPDSEVPVSELLRELERLPAREAIQTQLAAALLQQPEPVFDALGAQLRIKTWSWHRGSEDRRIGGFAGWRSDGRALWAEGQGTSRSVLQRHAGAIARLLPPARTLQAGECVEVRMFARYPLARIEALDGSPAPRGALEGRYRLHFARGNTLSIESGGELLVQNEAGVPQILARLSREDYVARVLQREGHTDNRTAARVLAIAIRSYLAQQAETGSSCLRIDDSSRRQRVSPRPASAEAREAAAFSEGLVLTGMSVQYHADEAAPGKLSWAQLLRDAESGATVQALLRQTWPQAELVAWGRAQTQCEALPEAQAWLATQRPRWRPLLAAEFGHEERPEVQVCRLRSGRPFADRARQRVHIRGLRSQQDQLDLTHEYLHLAFEAHPHGQDEDFIEAWARRLVLGQ